MNTDYLFLKLRFSGLSTQQIHRLLKFKSNFLSYTKREQQTILKLYLSTTKSQKKYQIYQDFVNYHIDAILMQLSKWNINFIGINHPSYPNLLREIHDPPFILFYKGDIALTARDQNLAIVGSRHATDYTRDALKFLFPSFKKKNLTIVSGLAVGADQIAHQYAIENHMSAIAVLAFGHLNHYPKSTQKIRKQLEQTGLVISEYLPYQKPLKHHFPERNRLISGLSKGVLITESTIKSGTSITTNCALEQNREVYVLPGSMFNEMTMGNLMSAQEGAKIVISPKDIIDDFD